MAEKLTKQTVNRKSVASTFGYSPVYQDTPINSLVSLTNGFFRGVKDAVPVDKDGKVTVNIDGVLYTVDFSKISLLSARTHQFLMFLIRRYTRLVGQASSDSYINKNLELTFSFSEIAEAFHLSVDSAKPMAVQAAEALQHLTITTHWRVGRSKLFESANVLQSYKVKVDTITRKGTISVMFGSYFAKFMTHMSVLWYPDNLFMIPPKKFPSAYLFGYMLTLNLKCNHRKSNRNRLSVRSLLLSASEIPKRESLDTKKGMIHRRIIEPFIRDMDALVLHGVLSFWELEFNRKVVKREQYANITYEDFIECIVIYRLAGNPEGIYFKQDTHKAISCNSVTYSTKNDVIFL